MIFCALWLRSTSPSEGRHFAVESSIPHSAWQCPNRQHSMISWGLIDSRHSMGAWVPSSTAQHAVPQTPIPHMHTTSQIHHSHDAQPFQEPSCLVELVSIWKARATFYCVLHTAQHSTSNIHWMEEAHSFAAIDNLVNIPFLFRVCVFICILVCLFLFIKLQGALEEELGRKSQDDQTISWDLGFQFFF